MSVRIRRKYFPKRVKGLNSQDITVSKNVSGSFSVASYNIHRFVGIDGRFDPDRIGRVIGELRSDIVGLQEIDSEYYRKGDHAARVSRITGLDVILGPTRRNENGHFGNALLTSHTVKEIRRIDLSVYGRTPRGALDVDLLVKGESIRVIVAHLGLSPRERRKQVKRLLDIFCSEQDRMEIMLGDFNAWGPVGRPLHWIHGVFGKPPVLNTYPSFMPILPLDRIWIRPLNALVSVSAHKTELSRLASDHLPVKALIVRVGGNGEHCGSGGLGAELASQPLCSIM
jgi:endonuclease/exonuclease/phosphatase family metal-dependent hydrolase